MKLTREEVQEALHPAPEGCVWSVTVHFLRLVHAGGVIISEKQFDLEGTPALDLAPEYLNFLRWASEDMAAQVNFGHDFPSGVYH